MLSVSDCISFGILTSEVISNSIKHAFEGIRDPKISIDLTVDQEFIIYCIRDNGVGLNLEEKNRPTSLGLRLIDVFARQLDAYLSIESDDGVVVKMKIPLRKEI